MAADETQMTDTTPPHPQQKFKQYNCINFSKHIVAALQYVNTIGNYNNYSWNKI